MYKKLLYFYICICIAHVKWLYIKNETNNKNNSHKTRVGYK